jgi:hypothetical protein
MAAGGKERFTLRLFTRLARVFLRACLGGFESQILLTTEDTKVHKGNPLVRNHALDFRGVGVAD